MEFPEQTSNSEHGNLETGNMQSTSVGEFLDLDLLNSDVKSEEIEAGVYIQEDHLNWKKGNSEKLNMTNKFVGDDQSMESEGCPERTTENKLKCPSCPYITSRKGNLMSHSKIHSGEKPSKCPQCSYTHYTNIPCILNVTERPKTRKRKYEEENRVFKQEWEERFAFSVKSMKPFCLLCRISLKHFKVSNLRRHHETNHKSFISEFPPDSEQRKAKIRALKSSLCVPETTAVPTPSKNSDLSTEASFVIAWNIACAQLPYSIGEFVKKNIIDVVSILAPGNVRLRQQVQSISISRHTTERRISQISDGITQSLQTDLKNCVAFSLALESTDIRDNSQLAVFVRYITCDGNVKEKLLDIITLREPATGVSIKQAVDESLSNAQVPLSKLVSVATDGTPVMAGQTEGLVGLLKLDANYPVCTFIHCIIHPGHLVSKYFRFENVTKYVLEILNFISANAKTHQGFRQFIDALDLQDKPDDLAFDSVVLWLSTSNLLNKFVAILEPLIDVLKEMGTPYPQLEEHEWVQDLMFLTDVTRHLQNLNLSLQGKDNVISDLTQKVFSFHNKIKLFQKDLLTKKFDHFPHLKFRANVFPDVEINDAKLQEYRGKLEELSADFKFRFDELKKLKPCFEFLVNPFLIDVINGNSLVTTPFVVTEAPAIEAEVLELQEDIGLQMMHRGSSVIDFWKEVPEKRYPHLRKTSFRLISVFGTFYCCDSLFSVMNFIKSKHRSALTHKHLTELVHTALTSHQPDFKALIAGIKTQSKPTTSRF